MRSRTVSATIAATFVLVLGIVCLINGARKIGRPFPGFLVAQNGIVMSVARTSWPVRETPRVFFAKLIAIDGEPIGDANQIQARLVPHKRTEYRFRKGANFFTEVIPPLRFTASDFTFLYLSYFAVGIIFVACSLWVFTRSREPAVSPFFLFSLSAGLTLFTGGDVYGPYWFTTVYLFAQATAPAALFHFALSYPEPIGGASTWRRIAVASLYACSLGLGTLLNVNFQDPSQFLPLLYVTYLLLANAILLHLARVAINLASVTDPADRRALQRALAGVLLAGTVAGIIFVIYPVLQRPVPPIALVAPLALFPLLTASALFKSVGRSEAVISVRSRLSFLFLGTIETTFLIGVGMFWLNASWQELLDDLTINQAQRSQVEHVLSGSPEPKQLFAVLRNTQTVGEQSLVQAAGAALEKQDSSRAVELIKRLQARYETLQMRLTARRASLVRASSALVVALVLVGVMNAVAFVFVVRRWLVRPIRQLATATTVIATGNLAHRIQLTAADEFGLLARSMNTMAESLSEIQRRIHREREARSEAVGIARDSERRRLARELHDSLLQNLSAIKFRLESGSRTSAQPGLRDLVDQVIKCMAELDAIVHDLRSPDLGRLSLGEAIRTHAHTLASGQGIELQFELAEAPDVASWASQDVYRIAQEAIANAIQHGKPRKLAIVLATKDNDLALEIRDDGRGFDSKSIPAGNGLLGMRERAAALGATLKVESTPGTGTLVRLTLLGKTDAGHS